MSLAQYFTAQLDYRTKQTDRVYVAMEAIGTRQLDKLRDELEDLLKTPLLDKEGMITPQAEAVFDRDWETYTRSVCFVR